MLKQVLTIAIVFLAAASVANATVLDVHWESQDGDPTVVGSVQNTLFTTMTNDWTNAVILIDLIDGELLNPLPQPPPFNDQRNWGANEDDSWVDSPNNLYGYPTIIFFDLDGTIDPPYEEYEGYIDWFDTGNNGAVDNGIAARVYASDDAQGSYLVKMYDRDSAGVPTLLTGDVINGAFAPIPEPASISMLLLGFGTVTGLMMIRRKRKC